MKVEEWLNEVGYLKEHPDFGNMCWYSKFDDSYITPDGQLDIVTSLAELDITEQLTHGVGFSPTHNKWYGWSHRAIYGFTIGSTCKKGDCHYKGSTIEEQKEAAIAFWEDEYHVNVRVDGIIEEGGDRYFDISWEYTDDVPNKSIRGTTGGVHHHIGELGRGEWVAETMEDAKQMAIDFNGGVS